MRSEGKHVCMLRDEPTTLSVSPQAGLLQRLTTKFRALLLPCEWHHSSMLFLRSHKKLEIERRRQLTSGYWFVWHPYSPLKFYWELYKLTLYVIAFFQMPLIVFRSCVKNTKHYRHYFVIFTDCMAFLDVAINFMTGRTGTDGRSVILEPRMIAVGYAKSDFIIDLISAIPFQLIPVVAVDRCDLPTRTVWFPVKLLRLRAMSRAWKLMMEHYEQSYIKSVSMCLVFLVFCSIHWMTFIHFQVPTFFANLYPNEPQYLAWYKKYKVIAPDSTPVSPVEKYITNLFHVCGICIGSTSAMFNIIPDLLMNGVLGLVGLLFATYVFTTTVRLIFYSQYENYIYTGRLKQLQEYLSHKRLPIALRQKIQLFIDYKYNGHFFNEKCIIETLNEQIKQEINMFSCKRIMVNVPLFKEMPIAVINTIIFSLKKVLFMPGEVIIRNGTPGTSLYLIASGTVTVIDANDKEVAHLTDGAYFGERALLYPGTERKATVIALEITEVYKLSHTQLARSLAPNPRLKRRLEQAVREHALGPIEPGEPGEPGEERPGKR